MTRLFGIFSSGNQNFRSLANHCISECDGIPQPIHCEGSIVPTSPNPYFQTKNQLHFVVTTTTRLVQYTIHILQSILVLPSYICPCLRLRVYNHTGIPTRLQGEFEDFFTRGRGEVTRAPTMQVPPAPAQITQPMNQGFLIEVPPGGCHTISITYCITFINSTWYLQ